MKQILRSLWSDAQDRDLKEYALVAGFVVVAAGVVPPGVLSYVRQIWAGILALITG